MGLRAVLTATMLAAATFSAACASRRSPHAAAAPPEYAQDAPDASVARVVVSNHNPQTVRLILKRGSGSSWLGVVAPGATRTIALPAGATDGAPVIIRVLTANGQEWDARGVVPRVGSVLRLDVAIDIRSSSWSRR